MTSTDPKKVTMRIGHTGNKLHRGLVFVNDKGQTTSIINACGCSHRPGQHISVVTEGHESANCGN